jgi:CRISPR-associated exonuclease Cas4
MGVVALLTGPILPLILVSVGVALVAGSAWALLELHRARRFGQYVGSDTRGESTTLRSERWRLVGRPDLLRRLPDGRSIPIEIKSRTSPERQVPYSHLVQVWAYCALLEETSGKIPPYGVLRYADGREWCVPWGAMERTELWRLRSALAAPYRGQSHPSPGRCWRCPYRPICPDRSEHR